MDCSEPTKRRRTPAERAPHQTVVVTRFRETANMFELDNYFGFQLPVGRLETVALVMMYVLMQGRSLLRWRGRLGTQ